MAPGFLAAVIFFALVGLGAGLLDGAAGLGGGILMIAALSTILSPQEVVVITAPVLLVGSTARVWMFRRHVDRPLVAWYVLGAAPAIVIGGVLLPHVPRRALEVGMALFLLAFLMTSLIRFDPARGTQALPTSAFAGVGAASGFVAATVGGAGPITAPFVSSRGLTKEGFVGTMAAVGWLTVLLKTAVYSASGIVPANFIPAILFLSTMVLIGTVLGKQRLNEMRTQTFRRLLLAVVAVAAIRLLAS